AVPELLAFVNDLFAEMGQNARRPDDFKYDEDDRFPVDSRAESRRVPAWGVLTGPDSDECAAAVATEIARILREETVRDKQTGIARAAAAGDVGILFRSRA